MVVKFIFTEPYKVVLVVVDGMMAVSSISI